MGLGRFLLGGLGGVSLLAAFSVAGCDSEKLNDGVTKAQAYPATFSAVRDRILVPRCQYCHADFESYAVVKAEAEEIYEEVEEGGMPLNGTALTEEQIKAIESWIAKGSKND